MNKEDLPLNQIKDDSGSLSLRTISSFLLAWQKKIRKPKQLMENTLLWYEILNTIIKKFSAVSKENLDFKLDKTCTERSV